MAVIVLAFVLIVPKLVDLNRYKALITEQIQKAVGGNVKLGHIAWGFIGRRGFEGLYVDVDGFSIENATAFPGDIKALRAHAAVAVWPLFSKRIVIKKVLIVSPAGTLRLKPKSSYKKTVPETPGETSKPVPEVPTWPVELSIKEVILENGRMIIEDSVTIPGQQVVHTISYLTARISNLVPGDVIHLNFSFRDSQAPGFGQFSAQGTIAGLTDIFTLEKPELDFQATLSEVDMDALKILLREETWLDSIRGMATLSLNIKGDPTRSFRADGTVDLSRIIYSDSSMSYEIEPGKDARLAFRIIVDPGEIEIERLDVASDNLAISAKARLNDWTAKAVLTEATLTADLPLEEVEPYIPWHRLDNRAGIVQKVMKNGGRISIEKATIPDIEFNNLPDNPIRLLSRMIMLARVSGISAEIKSGYPKIHVREGRIHWTDGVIKIDNLSAETGPAEISDFSATISNILDGPEAKVLLKGPLKITDTQDRVLQMILSEWGLKRLNGVADLDLSIQLALKNPAAFTLNGNLGLRKFNVATIFNPASIRGLDADVRISSDRVDITNSSAAVHLPTGKASPGGRFKLNFEGMIKNWRKNPTLSIRSLDTSMIAMRSLKPSIPWEKLDPETRKIVASLVEDGSIRVKGLVVPNIALTRPPAQPTSLLKTVRAAVELQDVSVKPFSGWHAIEGITGLVAIENNTLTADDVKLRSGPVILPDLDLQVTNISDKPKVNVNVEGSVNLGRKDLPEIDAILKDYGLKNINGNLDMQLQAQYDHARPEKWEAKGLVKLSGIQTESDPAGIKMENLNGQVTLSRKKTLEITVKKVTGKIEDAPIRLNGRFVSGGKQDYFLDAAVLAQKLDLAHVVALFPELKETELAGMLDMDLSVRYSASNPAATRLKGKLESRALGLRLPKKDISLKSSLMDVTFTGNGIRVNNMALEFNDQPLWIKGRLMDPKQPDLQLALKSENLDLDRILAPLKKKEPQSQNPAEPTPKTSSPKNEKSANNQPPEENSLPPFAANLSALVTVEVAEGRYRNQTFQNLTIEADYKKGILNQYDIDVAFGGGSIQNSGRADLRKLNEVVFETNPAINNVRMESIGGLIEGFEPSLRAPVSIKGSLKGKTGSTPELIESLSGDLALEVRRGRFTNIGPAGKGLAKILSIVNIQGLLSGRLVQDMVNEGITIRYISASAAFKDGNMELGESRMNSDALNINGRGTVDLLNQQVDLDVDLEPLGTVTGVLKRVPLVGRTAASFTKIYTDVRGPLDNPDVRIRPTRTLTRGVQQGARSVGKTVGGGANR